MDDLDFSVSDKKGVIIVMADNTEQLKLAFDYSIHIKVLFNLLKDSKSDVSEFIDRFVENSSSRTHDIVVPHTTNGTSQNRGLEKAWRNSDHCYSTVATPDTTPSASSEKQKKTTNRKKRKKKTPFISGGNGRVQEPVSSAVQATEVSDSTSDLVPVSSTVHHTSESEIISKDGEKDLTASENVMPEESEMERPKRKKVTDSMGDYYCSECDMAFSERSLYAKHVRIHLCEDSESEKSDLRFSEMSDDDDNDDDEKGSHYSPDTDIPESSEESDSDFVDWEQNGIECEYCDRVLRSTVGYENHLRNHNKYLCNICEKVFKRKSDYVEHRAKQHGLETKYLCKICGQSFELTKELTEHRKSHKYVPEEFKCALCEETFQDATALNSHAKTAGHDGIYCQICKEELETPGLLHCHWRQKHLDDEDEAGTLLVKQCSDCLFMCLSDRQMEFHKRRMHDRSVQLWTCDLCQKRFRLFDLLQRHLKQNHDPSTDEELKYACETCGQVVSASKLPMHRARHRRGKIYRCNMCPKSFITNSRLARHMLTHTKEKPYQCEICAKCFNQAINLTTHMRTHTKVKPFPCQFCELAFSHKCTLQGHIASKHRLESIQHQKASAQSNKDMEIE